MNRLKDFTAGLRCQSFSTVSSALVLSLLLIASLEYSLQHGILTYLPKERLLLEPEDQFTHLSYELAKLKTGSVHEKPVILLGGSSMRESISSVEAVEEALKKMGHSTKVHNFGSYIQSFGQSVAILDQIPGSGGIILIGLNLRRFTLSPAYYVRQIKGELLLINSPSLATFLNGFGYSNWTSNLLLPGFTSYWKKYYRRHRHVFRSGSMPWNTFKPHFYEARSQLSPVEKTNILKMSRVHFYPDLFEHFEFNLKGLEWLVEVAKKRGFRVVLLELPMEDAAWEFYREAKPIYQAGIDHISQKHEIPYWNFLNEIGLTTDDYNDYSHLIESGRVKYQERLIEKLSQYTGPKNG